MMKVTPKRNQSQTNSFRHINTKHHMWRTLMRL